jgi:hypothetical protein
MHNGTRQNDSVVMLNAIMLTVADNPSMLSVVILNDTMLNVANSTFMLSIVMLNVVMLSVMAPKKHFILP